MKEEKQEENNETSAGEKLLRKSVNVWDILSAEEVKETFSFAEGYKNFLDEAKTEREAVSEIMKFASRKGFSKKESATLPGKKICGEYHKKSAYLAVLGDEPIEKGINIIVSHIDAPRLDLKQNPLYEEVDLAFLKTHYYGGIKKYQWLSRPLALHGKIIKKDRTEIDLKIGEKDDDPVFTISDLLPHLARKAQYEKKLDEAIKGEKLNILVGSIPYPEKKVTERFKLQVLSYLNENYGLIEEDFISADLEIVPADKAKDIGWDRSLVGGYGQDDRACAYTSLRAIVDMKKSEKTALVLFMDKEEIGSEGNTGAKSRLIEAITAELIASQLGKTADEGKIREALMNSRALSADVNGALDPDYQDVHEKRNAAKLGYGICVSKFTGYGGKRDASEAHAEYLGWLRETFNRHNIIWQAAELGKVDEGGGGTVAKFMAAYGMEIIDCGTPILGIHSPYEISSKGDIYMTYKAYKVFLAAR